jgi:peptidoglycan-N-acetylglucosamine deacetylase
VEHPVNGARYVGAGWAAAGYEAVALDDTGRIVASFAEPFSGDGLSAFVARIAELTWADDRSACSVDTTSGLLGDALLSCGVRVDRVIPGPIPADSLCSMEPHVLAAAARHATKVLSPDAGMAQGRTAELLQAIVAAKHTERGLERQGGLLKRVTTQRQAVALTFDDGPAPGVTDRILDVLGKFGVQAVFFCVGSQVRTHEELARRAIREGHLLGNHSFSHAFLPDLSPAGMAAQITVTERIIDETVGVVASYFRPPYGARSLSLLQMLPELNLTAVLWDVDPRDWRFPVAGQVIERVLGQVRSGSIVLLHDGPTSGAGTAAMLPALIARLREMQFELLRLDEMASTK